MVNTEIFIKQIDENKQISRTGSRALVLLILLLGGPKNFEEIQNFFLDTGIVEKEYSIDTIRIDINTLKSIGCEITKAIKRNNHKYGLVSHPFELKLTTSDVSTIKSLYRKLAKTASPQKLVKYHRIFEKLTRINKDENTNEQLLGISLLKKTNIDLLEELVADEKKFNKVRIEYLPSNNDKPVEYDISPEKFGIRNGKVYLYCYNHTLKERSFLPITKIKSIVCKMFDRTSAYGLDTIIKFKLDNYKTHDLDENEVIVQVNGTSALIEGHYFNEFIAIQRILFFANDCTVTEPEDIKTKIIDKLKEMRSIYE